ncbi:phenylacetate--CoA ligase family protein [Candidatus Woesearchaeota archaeon]|jgi:phenylacetate-CoA ligase|nr:phenylacetate--CoA ligase family protein [Candidatus Woesearchaeota archaeon]
MISRLMKYLPVEVSDFFMDIKANDVKFMKNIILNSNPSDLEYLSKKKVLKSFHRAALRVPHYSQILSNQNINPKLIKSFKDFATVPIISKVSYIKTATKMSELCIDRDLSQCGLLARSSGYTGHSSTWAKSRSEQIESRHFASLGLDLLFGVTKSKTLLIDCFALGSWVSGVDLLMIGSDKCSIIAPGADSKETLDIFNDLKEEYDQFIFAGTPHFIKNLVEEGIERGIDFKKSQVNLLLGAEAFTEEWRQYMHSLLGSSMGDDKKGFIFSAFGASDLGVTGINETKESAYLRYLCLTNSKLKTALFGDYATALPMLFQYDPTKFFIENTEKDELVFSNCDLKASLPLIRYNIHDVGKPISFVELNKILKEQNIDLKIKAPLPFLFVVGRSDGTINFIGQLIYPQYIQELIYSNDFLSKLTTGTFKLIKMYDKDHNPFLQIDIQLRKNIKKSKDNAAKFHEAIHSFFMHLSTDFPLNFEILEEKTGKNPLIINCFEFDKYPHKSGIKIRYV